MIHGDELRRVLRQICACPLPVRDDETLQRALKAAQAPQRPQKVRQPLQRRRGHTRDAATREAMRLGNAKRLVETMKRRPEGHITRKEAAAEMQCSLRHFNLTMKRHQIVAACKTGQISWYSRAALVRAGILTAALLLAVLPSVAGAQELVPINTCLDAKALRQELFKKYGERTAGVGVTPKGDLVEMTMDPKDGSFTIFRLKAGGKACLLAAGEDWQYAIPSDPA